MMRQYCFYNASKLLIFLHFIKKWLEHKIIHLLVSLILYLKPIGGLNKRLHLVLTVNSTLLLLHILNAPHLILQVFYLILIFLLL